MNLVDSIKGLLTGEVTRRLGSLLGGSEAQARSALGAAVPALLSAFSGLASGGGGEQLAAAVNKLGAGSIDRTTAMLADNPEAALEQGQSQLGNLLGGGTVSALASTLGRFLGFDGDIVKKLLGYISPLVLGSIAKQFQGAPATARGLNNFFAEQKTNIADALPSGLSLANVPGIPDVGSAVAGATKAVQRTADDARASTSPLLKTLLPLAILAAIGFLAWQFFKPREQAPAKANESVTQRTAMKPISDIPATVPKVALPEAAKVSQDLNAVFSTAQETISGIKDAATAESAIPKLNELIPKLGGLTELYRKLPESARGPIEAMAKDNLRRLSELIEKVKAIPGVKEKAGAVLDTLLEKVKAFDQKT